MLRAVAGGESTEELDRTNEQVLKIENFKLKVRINDLEVLCARLNNQLADRNARLMSIQLQQEKTQLDKELGNGWEK